MIDDLMIPSKLTMKLYIKRVLVFSIDAQVSSAQRLLGSGGQGQTELCAVQ